MPILGCIKKGCFFPFCAFSRMLFPYLTLPYYHIYILLIFWEVFITYHFIQEVSLLLPLIWRWLFLVWKFLKLYLNLCYNIIVTYIHVHLIPSRVYHKPLVDMSMSHLFFDPSSAPAPRITLCSWERCSKDLLNA